MRADMFRNPDQTGWYGLLFGDGEGEVWIGAGYWDGTWHENVSRAYARSSDAFASHAEAMAWASSQAD